MPRAPKDLANAAAGAALKVSVMLPVELIAKLDERAASERRTRSSSLRLLIEDALGDNAEQPRAAG